MPSYIKRLIHCQDPLQLHFDAKMEQLHQKLPGIYLKYRYKLKFFTALVQIRRIASFIYFLALTILKCVCDFTVQIIVV